MNPDNKDRHTTQPGNKVRQAAETLSNPWQPDDEAPLRPLRVMHVMGGRFRSGVDSVVLTLAEGLFQSGGEAIVTPLWGGYRIEEEAREQGLTVDPLDKKRRYDVLSFPRLAGLIRKHRVDIVHSHELNGAFYASPAARLARVAHINSYHSDPRNTLRPVYSRKIFIHLSFWYYLRLLRSCDRVITVAPNLRQDMIQGGVPRDNIVVIPTAIDLKAYDPACSERDAVRNEIHLPLDATVIGTAGRLSLEKNLPMLLNAGKRLIDAGENVRILIAGEGNVRKSLERMAVDLGIEPYVCFTGFRDDMPRIMSTIDIFALTSKGEGMPIVILEAMGVAKPVVATDVGGMSTCVVHGETGLLVPSGDVGRMADSLRALIKNSDQAHRFGRAGRVRVEQEFNQPTMVKRTMNVYEEVVGSKGPPGK